MGYTTLYESNEKPASMLFISHGGGPWPLIGDPRHSNLIQFLGELPSRLVVPSSIVVISAHWEEEVPVVQSGPHPSMYYDYYGFPEETYHISYPAPGNSELAGEVKALLEKNAIPARLDGERGFDHGVFVPLMLMYPDADIPCLQVSLLQSLDPARHINLGRALRALRRENILIVGSGSSFHNLPAFREKPTEKTAELNKGFEAWLLETMTGGHLSEEMRQQRLINWSGAPGARYCHPREEHLLPLHVCYGAAGRGADTVIGVEYMERQASMYLWSSELE
jgi:4,5-DOPA dioxygenase extradiol